MSKFVDTVKAYLMRHKEVSVVSFDLFNTLVLRYVQTPEDVFWKAGSRMQLPPGITAEDYKYVRQQAQKRAQTEKKKNTGTAEVNLRDIAEHLPGWINQSEAVEAEIEAEKELDFGNPEMSALISWLEERKYRIIYISDMYLQTGQIEAVLSEAKLPRHKIFVSNELEADKRSGELFKKVMDITGWDASEMIHIGDNFEADMLGAEKCGIKAFLYGAPYADASSGLAMESFVLGNGWTDKNIQRHIAGAFWESDDEEMNKWSAVGAQIVGPVTAYFMEWLGEQIKRKKDDILLFFMREGSFFQKAWRIYSGYCGIEIANKLVYVSRRALLLPMMEQFGEKELEMVLEAAQITLGEVFGLLGIHEWEDRFTSCLDVRRKDFDSSLYDAVKAFLLSEKCKTIIEARIKEEKKRAEAYFESFNLRGRVATVDIGYQGTIQKRVEKAAGGNGQIYWDHFLLLCNGLKRLEEPERDNIIGALGTYCGEDSDLMSVVNRNNRSLELLFLEGCGSCIGYEWKKGRAVPVLEELCWPEKQKRQIAGCQRGALAYLQLYFGSGKRRKWLRKEILQILHRFLSSPGYSEAELLGNLVFDENNGTRYARQICETKDIEKIKKVGMKNWQQETDYREVQWIEGLMALGNPAGILQQGNRIKGYNESYALHLVERLSALGKDNVYIVAAGTVGRLVAKYAKIVNIRIKAFVDNNVGLWGKAIDNIPIISFEECEKDGLFVIASIPYREELKRQASENINDRASIIF